MEHMEYGVGIIMDRALILLSERERDFRFHLDWL